MSSLVVENNNFRSYAAQQFLSGLINQSTPNNLYVWMGKITPWSNDSEPPQPNDTVEARIANFADMMVIKRIAPSDVSLVIPNNTWTASTVYTQYTDQGAEGAGGIYYDLVDPTTSSAPFYVITSDNNVYKCLNNNNGTPSSVMPT